MASERYNPRVAEAHWQKIWEENQTFDFDISDPLEKYYVLDMFPHPSVLILIGFARNHLSSDVLARF